MLMTWRSLLFIHWPVPAEALQPLVPEPLEIDTFDGRAWVGLIPFTMPSVRMTRLPTVPTTRRFHECNVRTYVTDRDQPGVYFFSLDAASRLAVWCARRFWHLNYCFSRIDVHQEGDVIHYAVDRAGNPAARMRCAWRRGSTREQSKPGELAYFLTERYMLYTVNRQGRLLGGRIWHRPWPLRNAIFANGHQQNKCTRCKLPMLYISGPICFVTEFASGDPAAQVGSARDRRGLVLRGGRPTSP